MKTKLALIVALAILVGGLVGCSQDADEGNTGILSTVSVGGTGGTAGQECVTLWAGQNIDAGTVCIEINDPGLADGDEEICITYNTKDGWELVETHAWVGDTYAGYPQTRQGNPKIGNFPIKSGDITGETTWTVCIPLSEWGTELGDGSPADLCGKVLYVAAHAALQLNDGSGNIIQTETGWGDGENEARSWATFFSVEMTCTDGPPEPPVVGECETAFAYGNTCFLEIDASGGGPYNRWGWTNGPLGVGTYTSDIYAGAGQCDIDKGTHVGTLTVVYEGSTATVTFDVFSGFTMDETHLYVGNEILPRDVNGEYTVAPGQFPDIHDELPNPTTTDMYTIEGLSGDIYVVAHAVVCGEYVYVPCTDWIVYGSNLNGGTEPFDDAIYAYDLNNQTQTLVYDPTPIDNDQNYPNANAYDPVNKRIYFGTNDGRLYYHQIGSGTHVQVEGDAVGGSFGTMACGSWYNGRFYYVQNGTNKLWAVSVVANVATRALVGEVPVIAGYGDIAFDPVNPGRFIGSAIGTATDGKWYWYDVNTNASALLTEGGDSLNHKQLAYGSDGVLYGVNATGGDFYSIVYSVADGTITLTADWVSTFTFTDLASGPQCN